MVARSLRYLAIAKLLFRLERSDQLLNYEIQRRRGAERPPFIIHYDCGLAFNPLCAACG